MPWEKKTAAVAAYFHMIANTDMGSVQSIDNAGAIVQVSGRTVYRWVNEWTENDWDLGTINSRCRASMQSIIGFYMTKLSDNVHIVGCWQMHSIRVRATCPLALFKSFATMNC